MKKKEPSTELPGIEPFDNPETLSPGMDFRESLAETEQSVAATQFSVVRKIVDRNVGISADPVAEPQLLDEFFLPIHGFVMLSREEKAVCSHPAIQRLRQVYQLGQTYYVYPGATHTRYEHVLGTVSVVASIAAHIKRNYEIATVKGKDSPHNRWRLGAPLNPTELAFVRLAALLHDVGHLPAGHTLEDELGLLDKHDNKERIDRVSREAVWYGIPGCEPLESIINEEFRKFIPEGLHISPYDLVLSIILKEGEAPLGQADLGASVRLQACRDIVGNTVCADLLDYLYRDWYHIGKSLPAEDRLYQYMQIRSDSSKDANDGAIDRFVIWVGEESNIKSDAFSAILSLLERRYELAEAVLFHKTKCLATAMLERGLFELFRDLAGEKGEGERVRKDLVSELLEHTDISMLRYFQEKAGDDMRLSVLFSNLRARRLFKTLFSHRCEQRGATADEKIGRVYGLPGSVGATHRLEALQRLEKEFGLPRCSLAMYCPTKKMNAKVAQVQVYIDDEVTVLSRLEGREQGVDGHLRAQISRFRTLWRVQVGIDQDVMKMLTPKKIEMLQLAIERIVLGIGTHPQIERASFEIATFLATDESSPYSGRQPGPVTVAAQSGSLHTEVYPSNYPAFSRYYASLG